MTIYKSGRRLGGRRMSDAQRAVLELLRSHETGQISYDDMAAAIGRYDRRTLVTAVRMLEHKHALIIERPRGCLPNRYALVLNEQSNIPATNVALEHVAEPL